MQALAAGVESVLAKKFFEQMGFIVIILPMEGEAKGSMSWATNLDNSCLPEILTDVAGKVVVENTPPQGSA